MASPITAMLLRPFMRRRNASKLIIATSNGINEARFIRIGGIDQWVTIRGRDTANPILLIVHGGPGSPYTPFNSWLTEWEKVVTIVQWEHRGAGRTFEKNGTSDDEQLTIDVLASDGIELAETLLKHLDHRKLILLGSSVGSIVGAVMAKRRPDLFAAYIGAEQNGFPEARADTYSLTAQALEKARDKKGLKHMAEMGADPSRWTQAEYERMNKLAIKASTHVPNMIYDLMLPALMYAPDCSMKDIRLVQRGMEYSMRQLFTELMAYDLGDQGYDFQIPFFIFQGEGDILTPAKSAQGYFDKVQAPHKEFVTIPHAGHLAEFANPERFLQELRSRVLPFAIAADAAEAST